MVGCNTAMTIQMSAKIETTRIGTNPVPRYCHIFVVRGQADLNSQP